MMWCNIPNMSSQALLITFAKQSRISAHVAPRLLARMQRSVLAKRRVFWLSLPYPAVQPCITIRSPGQMPRTNNLPRIWFAGAEPNWYLWEWNFEPHCVVMQFWNYVQYHQKKQNIHSLQLLFSNFYWLTPYKCQQENGEEVSLFAWIMADLMMGRLMTYWCTWWMHLMDCLLDLKTTCSKQMEIKMVVTFADDVTSELSCTQFPFPVMVSSSAPG
jgi:hypothetical protein